MIGRLRNTPRPYWTPQDKKAYHLEIQRNRKALAAARRKYERKTR